MQGLIMNTLLSKNEKRAIPSKNSVLMTGYCLNDMMTFRLQITPNQMLNFCLNLVTLYQSKRKQVQDGHPGKYSEFEENEN